MRGRVKGISQSEEKDSPEEKKDQSNEGKLKEIKEKEERRMNESNWTSSSSWRSLSSLTFLLRYSILVSKERKGRTSPASIIPSGFVWGDQFYLLQGFQQNRNSARIWEADH